MPLSPGDKLGPYELLAPIGAGGMGAVWKASDTRLDRTVAIKFIEGRFSERFEREAKTIASLNHPHICTLFDVGEDYLVMEYIDGEPIAGPLPVSEVVRLGAQIAEALDAAHRKGITHRDLKPGNVLVTKSGAKVIDFGLAKAGSAVSLGASDATLTKPLTTKGTILGTVPYMSPEQLQGHEADARSDIFALGCALYEMLTGKRAFDGQSQVSIMAAILEHEPAPITEPVVPAWLDRVIRRCLRKNPDDRWQSARDIAIELRDPAPTEASVAARTSRWPWVAACALLAGLAAWGWLRSGYREAPRESLRLSVTAPDGTRFAPSGFAVSPDGRTLALAAIKEGRTQLWLRDLMSGKEHAMERTDEASHPFWSPDGKQIGFFTLSKLKRVIVASGLVHTICDAPGGAGGAWGANGEIYFAKTTNGVPIQRIPESGGRPEPAVPRTPDELSWRWPVVVPGVGIIYWSFGSDPQRRLRLAVPSPGKPAESTVLVESVASGTNPTFLTGNPGEPSYLFFSKGEYLVARQFDHRTRQMVGETVALAPAPGVELALFSGTSVSQTGVLAYWDTDAQTPLVGWRDRRGGPLEVLNGLRPYGLSLSPDGTRILQGTGTIFDLATKQSRRLRAGSISIWSADGKKIVFRTDDYGVAVRNADGQGEARPLMKPGATPFHPLDWSPDGRYLLGFQPTELGNGDLKLLALDGKSEPSAYLATPAHERLGQFSPDGKWISYNSDESGTDQIYVQAFDGRPATGNLKYQVTNQGGAYGLWRRDGKEFYYISGQGKLVAVSVTNSGGSLSFGPPEPLFDQIVVPPSPTSALLRA